MAITPISGIMRIATSDAQQSVIDASDAQTAATTGTTPDQAAAAAKAATTLDRDAFLKLLVAQLKYQDPSKPVDPSEMISQSAQLSVVDQLDAIKQQLVSTSSSDRLGLASSLIGKQIAFNDSTGAVSTAVVTSVSFSGTTTVVTAGEWQVPTDAILGVAGAPAATTTTTTTTTTGTTTTGSDTTGTNSTPTAA
jgi:flagellar hook assembly protein FlgD